MKSGDNIFHKMTPLKVKWETVVPLLCCPLDIVSSIFVAIYACGNAISCGYMLNCLSWIYG